MEPIRNYSAGILVDNGKILLGKRSAARESYPNVWDFLGGHCLEGESYEDALRRELQEEVGVKPTVFESLVKIDQSPRFVMIIFLVHAWEGEISNRQPEEHDEITWFTFDQTADLTFPDQEYHTILKNFIL